MTEGQKGLLVENRGVTKGGRHGGAVERGVRGRQRRERVDIGVQRNAVALAHRSSGLQAQCRRCSVGRVRTEVQTTDGAHGVYVRYGGEEARVPAYPCEPKDLTGAGDMFAGAFLYGITHDRPPLKAARAGNFLAMKVITQIGARLHHGTRQFWDDAIAGK